MEFLLFSSVLEEIVEEEWGWQQHYHRYEGIQSLDCPDLIDNHLQLVYIEEGRVEAGPHLLPEEGLGDDGGQEGADGVEEVKGVHVRGAVLARASPDPDYQQIAH